MRVSWKREGLGMVVLGNRGDDGEGGDRGAGGGWSK